MALTSGNFDDITVDVVAPGSKDMDSKNSASVNIADSLQGDLSEPTEKTSLVDSKGRKRKVLKASGYAATKSNGLTAVNIALMTSNAALLKNTISSGPAQKFYIFFIVCTVISLVMQSVFAFLNLWVSSREGKLDKAVTKASGGTQKTTNLNSAAMYLNLAISVLNIVMNAFSVATK